jgi:hypothetical protein
MICDKNAQKHSNRNRTERNRIALQLGAAKIAMNPKGGKPPLHPSHLPLASNKPTLG